MCRRPPIHIPGNCPPRRKGMAPWNQRAAKEMERKLSALSQGYYLERVGVDRRGLPRYRLRIRQQ